MPFDTPQDAEDAFYDALESGDADAMAQVWESSTDIACLLPMTPLIRGPEVLEMWRSMFAQGAAFDIQVRHLQLGRGRGACPAPDRGADRGAARPRRRAPRPARAAGLRQQPVPPRGRRLALGGAPELPGADATRRLGTGSRPRLRSRARALPQ